MLSGGIVFTRLSMINPFMDISEKRLIQLLGLLFIAAGGINTILGIFGN